MSRRLPWFFTVFAIANLQLGAVLGSMYPTQPIASTKFSSGQLALVTWRDDGHDPLLRDTGHMRIDLYGNNSEYVTTLAKHVSPKACSHSVFIPPGLKSASQYTLRFITTDPASTIYTADFTIVSDSYLFPALPVIANTTLSPTSTRAFDAAVAPTVHTNPMGAHPGSPLRSSGSSVPKRNSSTKGNLETIRFRLLSILWPALVGISMAL